MRCFVIMPYGNQEKDPKRKEELDTLYEQCIKPAVESVAVPGHPEEHIVCHRGDKERRPGEIIEHILENLLQSEIAIAELTERNANVFYELGVRHSLSGATILLAESEENIPFDLRGQRMIIYRRDFEGGQRLRNEIVKAVQDVAASANKIDNPVRRFLFNREQEKIIRQIQSLGQAPGYDFMKELLQEMAALRKEFKTQAEEVRHIMKVVTAAKPGEGDLVGAHASEDLRLLEGDWLTSEGGRVYARVVRGVLEAPYCYEGNHSLTGHLYNFRRIGENVFARFCWIAHPEINGYVWLEIVNPDKLVGGWWDSRDVEEDVEGDITRIDERMPGMQPWELSRLSKGKPPAWAEKYFAESNAA